MKETVVGVVGYVFMYACMYVCTPLCVRVCTWLFVCMCVHPSFCTCVCILLWVYVWMCWPLFVCMYVFVCMWKREADRCFLSSLWDTICHWTWSSLFWTASDRDPPVCCHCWGGRYTTTPSLTWVLGIWTQILDPHCKHWTISPAPEMSF